MHPPSQPSIQSIACHHIEPDAKSNTKSERNDPDAVKVL